MEAWATVALVLGSNAIMGIVNWLVTRKQLKHSESQLEKQMEHQREVDKRERRREVRSEPLLRMRNELARMAGKGAKVGRMMASSDAEALEEFGKALADWGVYMESGEFEQVLCMQYDLKSALQADNIRLDYEIARLQLQLYWKLNVEERKGKKSEYYDQSMELIRNNRTRVAEVQSEMNRLLEEL